MRSIRAPNRGDFAEGVAGFLTSLPWLYLTHRYPMDAQRHLLQVLTLSGLDVGRWSACSLALATTPGWGSAVPLVTRGRPSKGETAWLKQSLQAIWGWAEGEGAPVGEPPHCPTYLLAYGYTKEAYLRDLRQVYGRSTAKRYRVPWPETPRPPQRPHAGFPVFAQAVAIMGETAGAIERLMAQGGNNGGRE